MLRQSSRWRAARQAAAIAVLVVASACTTVAPPPVAPPDAPKPRPPAPAPLPSVPPVAKPGGVPVAPPGTAPSPKPAAPPVPPVPPVPPPDSAQPTATFAPAAWSELPGWKADRVEEAWPALAESCRVLAGRAGWSTPCTAAAAIDPRNAAAVRSFFERHFTPHRVRGSDGTDSGLVTGYYEPLLTGSRVADGRFRFPIHATPDDLLTVDLGELFPELRNKRVRGRVEGRRVVPYYPRADIEAGRAPTRGKELAWVEDAVDLFFLQIQGSGRIRLTDGTTLRVGYADQNGHPYRSVGRVLVERGELTVEQASMQGIKQWVLRNPEKAAALLHENPSYVFFRELPANLPGAPDGPIGALGVALSAGRSVAVDRTLLPLGTPLYLATTRPNSGAPLQRLVLAQDTGGAIRGPLRIDFFWGFGEDAGREAGRMRQPGQVWLLWPIGVRLPNALPIG